tara:strand:+ start:1868 stop:3187 length:1320 start_codon:yes stop_codon:yes gene_type:complete
MQFLWKYIDDLVGKGLEWFDIAQLLFYASARLVPLALPISVLLSSIMTFGNLEEKYELAAMKSAGVSFRKGMSSLLFFVLIISISSFLFSNYYMPYANLKAGTLLYDIRKQKPALNIKPGMFYNGLEGFSIKINKKNDNGVDLEGIMIYDHNKKGGNNKVIIAERGSMYLSDNEKYFIISLENGHSYFEKNTSTRINENEKRPHQRVTFKKDVLRFDLSEFGMKRSSENLYRNHYAMMNNRQLLSSIDSLHKKITTKAIKTKKQLDKRIGVDSTLSKNIYNNVKKLSIVQETKQYTAAIKSARTNKGVIENANRDKGYRETLIAKHLVEWHRKWSLAFACIVMFLIGAPLGTIIKKGGFGMPVVVSIFFFIIYHILYITGEKMVKKGELIALEGMWIANTILLPIGIWLSYKATKDSNLLDWSYTYDKIKNTFIRQSTS